jgi:hypothetical protein
MARVRADIFTNTNADGAPTFTDGIVVTGIVTSTSFDGNVTGNVTGNADSATYANTSGISTLSESLTGTPNIIVGVITATSASFSGNVSIAGTITYEDVTNVDSVGLITARSGLIVNSGISTISGGANFDKLLREGVNITAGKLSDNTNINLENGMVHLFTTTETTTSTPNIRYNASTSLNSVMETGDAIAVTIITTAASGAYSAQLTIDGSAVTENWIGGSAPSDGGTSGVDIYSYTIIKRGSATYTVIANQIKTS